MQNSLNITLIQYDIFWMDCKANLTFLESQIKHLNTDLIVLPEMFNTGFSMHPKEIAEPTNGKAISWMQKMATELNTVICGSLCVTENNNYYNRFVFVTNKGVAKYYDKRHLFAYGGEDKVFNAGNSSVVFEYKGFKIKPFICYDLRFPVWSRNTDLYDIALYVANWPAKRAFAWNTLLAARAIENMSYVIGVNRIGTDGNKLRYQGDSQVVDALGNLVAECKDSPVMKQFCLQKEPLLNIRNQYSFLNDRDNFTIT